MDAPKWVREADLSTPLAQKVKRIRRVQCTGCSEQRQVAVLIGADRSGDAPLRS